MSVKKSGQTVALILGKRRIFLFQMDNLEVSVLCLMLSQNSLKLSDFDSSITLLYVVRAFLFLAQSPICSSVILYYYI